MGEYADYDIDDALDRMMRHSYRFDEDFFYNDNTLIPRRKGRRRERRESPEAISGILFGVLRDAQRSRGFSERLARLKVITRTFPCPCGSRLTFRTSIHGAFFSCVRYPDCRSIIQASIDGFPHWETLKGYNV